MHQNTGHLPTATISAESVYLPVSQTMATDNLILAQQFDQDILGDIQGAFGNFVESGQIWAMLAGFVLGYVFKSVTSYG